MDSHGNAASSSFLIVVDLDNPFTPTAPVPSTSPSNASNFIIPQTGGLIDLDCDSVFMRFGIRLIFFNLCEQQAAIASVSAGNLPAELPEGFSLVMGLDVDILTDGQSITTLPDRTGIQMDFPTGPEDEYAALYWDAVTGEWMEISLQLGRDRITHALNSSTGNELYKLTSDAEDSIYQILTTDKTGIFVLVRK